MNYKQKLSVIKTVIFDFDGVLTDGKVFLFQDEFVRNMNSKDSYAIQHAAKKGLNLVVITGGDSLHLADKLMSLGIQRVELRAKNKLKSLYHIQEELEIDLDTTAYMGDDLPDISLLEKVHVAACPQDAVPEVKQVCHYVSHKKGGEGAVRDLLEQILKVQNKWYSDEGYEW